MAQKILVVDIGGSNVKLWLSGRRVPIKIASGPTMTPGRMMRAIRRATDGWKYDAVSIGVPAPVTRNRAAAEPWNLGKGWVRFDFKKAFNRPVKLINDAAMQALGSYSGGNMLFLGLGTGMGSAMIRESGAVIPMELAHLPYKKGLTFEDYLGEAGMDRLGKRAWRKHVTIVVGLFAEAFVVDEVVLGGGNARHLRELPSKCRLGSNRNAFKGGQRLWKR